MTSHSAYPADVESNKTEEAFLKNETVHSFSWKQLNVAVKDRQTKQMKDLLCDVNGHVEQGLSLTASPITLARASTMLNLALLSQTDGR